MLRGLKRDRMISRTVLTAVPPRVDYALTGLGSSLLTPLSALETWAHTHMSEVASVRIAYDTAAASQ